jgi:hypothetical protein
VAADSAAANEYFKRACSLGVESGCKMVAIEEGTGNYSEGSPPEGAVSSQDIGTLAG